MKFKNELRQNETIKETKKIAISNVSFILSKKYPHLLSEWVSSIVDGTFKYSRMYKKEYGKLMSQEIKGKPYPERQLFPKGNIEFTKLLNQTPVVPSTEILFSKGDTTKDKINKVLLSNMSQPDKDDYLLHLSKQLS